MDIASAIRAIERAAGISSAVRFTLLMPRNSRHQQRMSTTGSVPRRSGRLGCGFSAVLDYAAGSNRRAGLFLVLVALVAFLPGFFRIPPVDRDEAYFAQATKQMIETGDYIDIRYQGDTRYRKPIGIYWLQAAIVNLAGAAGFPEARTTIWLYRVPSLIGAIGAVLATYWCALAGVSRRTATLAALFMASSILLGVEAHLAKTDATLLFTIVVAMGALARIYLGPREVQPARPRWKLLAIFWTMLAVGILIKGPIILMVVGLTIVTLAITDRSVAWLRALRPLAGAAWMFLLILPWFAAIYTRVGSEFFTTAINEDMMAKVVGAREFHGGPPGLYLLLFFLTFFPASALAFVAFPAVWAVPAASPSNVSC